jgi:FdhD protein
MSGTRTSSTGRVRVVEMKSGAPPFEREDEVASEEPLEIRVGRSGVEADEVPIAVTMRTPGHDFELAAGFALSEGLVRVREDIDRISYCTRPDEDQEFNVVNLVLAPGVPFRVDDFRRNVYTSSSCGVCGKAALERVRVNVPRGTVVEFDVEPEVLAGLPDILRQRQYDFDRTGGLHASGLFHADGRPIALREDVGRHNALDKLVGSRLLDGKLPDSRAILLVSGRACFELVQKAAIAGIPFLAAVGAPTDLAIRLAEEHRMTLVGFLRPGRFVVYAGGHRIAADA